MVQPLPCGTGSANTMCARRASDVVTEDVHARRTWLLFQEAFGKGIKVGIIAVPNPDYDADHWWRSSEGFREVIGEAVAYAYAKLLFDSLKTSHAP